MYIVVFEMIDDEWERRSLELELAKEQAAREKEERGIAEAKRRSESLRNSLVEHRPQQWWMR